MPDSISTSSCEPPALPYALLRALNRHIVALSWATCLLAALPALLLAWDAWLGQLGTNPLERLLRTPGHWALVLLIVVLTVTPIREMLIAGARALDLRFGRRLADWSWMIQLRRPLGLASFAYAALHIALYLSLDAGGNWREFAVDIRDKPFVLAGLAAFLLLVPLAVTSTDAWMRRLKRGWKRVHSLIYPAAILAALHFVWLSKPGVGEPYAYAAIVAVLLGYRVAARVLRGSEADGLSRPGTERREPSPGPPTDLIAIADPGFHRSPRKE